MLPARFDQVRATVLVVDDAPDMRSYLKIILELDSYQVETAPTGAAALRVLGEGYAPDVILLDVQMPGMDGLRTLRRLRKLYPKMKVIMCSGMDDPRIVRRAAALGAQAFLTKPIRNLYLSAAVEGCLSEQPERVASNSGNQDALTVAFPGHHGESFPSQLPR